MSFTNFPNGITSFGVPVFGGGDRGPIFGNVYFVDGTNGSDDHPGTSPTEAKATIQAMLTYQIANNSGLGDVIYVMPGTYIESLTGTMNKVAIIGLQTGGGASHMASIRPASSYSYTGSMTDSAFRNLVLMSPSTTNTEYAAIMPTYMGYSAIENCFICGRAAGSVVGIQIGTPTDDATVVKCDYSSISNNTISTFYGSGCQFAYGIQHGALAGTNSAYKQMLGTMIYNNKITASTGGISICGGVAKNYGSVISYNVIDSFESSAGPTYGIVSAVQSQDAPLVINNYIKAVTDCIKNFLDENVMGNWCALNQATPVQENPAGA